MADGNKLLVGQIALELNLLKKEHLNECLDLQAKMEDPKPIGRLLVELGHLKEEDLTRIVNEHLNRMNEHMKYVDVRSSDVLFGKLLVDNKRATAQQVNEGLRAQQDLAEAGILKRLGQILVDLGRLSDEDVEKTLQEQQNF